MLTMFTLAEIMIKRTNKKPINQSTNQSSKQNNLQAAVHIYKILNKTKLTCKSNAYKLYDL